VHSHRVVGADLSESSIEKAKTRLAEAMSPTLHSRIVTLPRRHNQLTAPGGQVLISLPLPSGTCALAQHFFTRRSFR
jgi:hypothetical protein